MDFWWGEKDTALSISGEKLISLEDLHKNGRSILQALQAVALSSEMRNKLDLYEL